ncbi:MAG TPA: DUF2314 domain-containing protein [Longimicrobium sp.]|nr:DUF2314 domain-containing protein [Longimicrobium sp.]
MPFLVLIAALLLGACGDGSAEPGDGGRVHVASVSEDGDTAFSVERDDPEMDRARERARCTVSELIRRFRAPPATQTELMLKGAFRDEWGTEYMWMEVLRIEGDSMFVGTVANHPGIVRSVSFGDTVSIFPAEVSDWYAVDRDTLIAGFTTRVHRARQGLALGHDTARGYTVDSEEHAWRRLESFCVPARL